MGGYSAIPGKRQARVQLWSPANLPKSKTVVNIIIHLTCLPQLSACTYDAALSYDHHGRRHATVSDYDRRSINTTSIKATATSQV